MIKHPELRATLRKYRAIVRTKINLPFVEEDPFKRDLNATWQIFEDYLIDNKYEKTLLESERYQRDLNDRQKQKQEELAKIEELFREAKEDEMNALLAWIKNDAFGSKLITRMRPLPVLYRNSSHEVQRLIQVKSEEFYKLNVTIAELQFKCEMFQWVLETYRYCIDLLPPLTPKPKRSPFEAPVTRLVMLEIKALLRNDTYSSDTALFKAVADRLNRTVGSTKKAYQRFRERCKDRDLSFENHDELLKVLQHIYPD